MPLDWDEVERMDQFNEFEWRCGKNLRPSIYDQKFRAVPHKYKAQDTARRAPTEFTSKVRPASSDAVTAERRKALSECGWRSSRFRGYKALGEPALVMQDPVEALVETQGREWSELERHAHALQTERDRKRGVFEKRSRDAKLRTDKYNVEYFVAQPGDKLAPRQPRREPQYTEAWEEVKKELALNKKVQKFMVRGKTFEDAHTLVDRVATTREYSVLNPRKLQSAGSSSRALASENTFGVDLLKETDSKISLFGGIQAKNSRTARDPMTSRPATADDIRKERERYTRGAMAANLKLASHQLIGGHELDVSQVAMKALIDDHKTTLGKGRGGKEADESEKVEVMVGEEDVERANERKYVVPLAYGHDQHTQVLKEEVNNFADVAEQADTLLQRRLHSLLIKRFPSYRGKFKSFNEVQRNIRVNEPAPAVLGAMRLRAEGYEIQSRVDHIRHHPWYEGMCTLCSSHMVDRLGHTLDPSSGELLLIHHVRTCLEEGKDYGVRELQFTAQQFTYEELQSRQLGNLLLFVLDKLNLDPFKDFCEWFKAWGRYDDVRWLRLSKVSPWATSKFTARWRKKTAASKAKFQMFSPMRRGRKQISAASPFSHLVHPRHDK